MKFSMKRTERMHSVAFNCLYCPVNNLISVY